MKHSMQRTKQQGFTLIELMIVVAIIGILAAVALPQYQNYTTKSKWAANVMSSDSLKVAISECLQTQGGLVASCDTLGELQTVVGFGDGTNFPTVPYGSMTLTTGTGAIVLTGTPAVGSCRWDSAGTKDVGRMPQGCLGVRGSGSHEQGSRQLCLNAH